MTNYNPKIHHRKSIRLKGYDYSNAGLYFITICCQNRTHFFGEIIDGEMILNDAGKMIEKQWLNIPERFNNTLCEAFIIMPNHFHAILRVRAPLVGAPENANEEGQSRGFAPTKISETGISAAESKGQSRGFTSTKISETEISKNKTIGDIIGAFKSITTNEYIKGVKTQNWKRFDGKLWQRNYWENIIRDEKAYINISEYIKNNPKKWKADSLR